MSKYKKKVRLPSLASPLPSNGRYQRAMQCLKEAAKDKKIYGDGKRPSNNGARKLKEWRDSWFSKKD